MTSQILAQSVPVVEITQDGSRFHWTVARPGGSLNTTSSESFPTALAAAEVAVTVARCNRWAIRLADWLRDSLFAGWQMEGMRLYNAGQPLTACTNSHMEQGWQAARSASQGIAVFGWPVAVDVMAEVA